MMSYFLQEKTGLLGKNTLPEPHVHLLDPMGFPLWFQLCHQFSEKMVFG